MTWTLKLRYLSECNGEPCTITREWRTTTKPVVRTQADSIWISEQPNGEVLGIRSCDLRELLLVEETS